MFNCIDRFIFLCDVVFSSKLWAPAWKIFLCLLICDKDKINYYLLEMYNVKYNLMLCNYIYILFISITCFGVNFKCIVSLRSIWLQEACCCQDKIHVTAFYSSWLHYRNKPDFQYLTVHQNTKKCGRELQNFSVYTRPSHNNGASKAADFVQCGIKGSCLYLSMAVSVATRSAHRDELPLLRFELALTELIFPIQEANIPLGLQV